MSVIFTEVAEPPAMTQEQLDKARAYADRIASVGGSLLANASQLRKLLDQVQPTDTPTDK